MWHHEAFLEGESTWTSQCQGGRIEFGRAGLGDQRRRARLIQVASALGQRPRASLPEASTGDEATLKAMYRFFHNDCVEHQAILDSHLAATIERTRS
jgi:hypothetical protein